MAFRVYIINEKKLIIEKMIYRPVISVIPS